MKRRCPLRVLTTNSEKEESPEKSCGVTKSTPRMSILKSFDPFYQSPLKQSASEAPGNVSANDENCDPLYDKITNLYNVSQNTLKENVKDFVESIIIDALNSIIIDDSDDSTLYKTADVLVLEDTQNPCDSQTLINISDVSMEDTTETSVLQHIHNEEINKLKNKIVELEKQLLLKNELIKKEEENVQIKSEHENNICKATIENSATSITQNPTSFSVGCCTDNIEIDYLKDIAEFEKLVSLKDEEITKIKEQMVQIKTEYEKNINLSPIKQICTHVEEINDLNDIIKRLQKQVSTKDEQLVKLEEQMCQKEFELEEQMKMLKEEAVALQQPCKHNKEIEELKEYEIKCKEKDECNEALRKDIAIKEKEFEIQMNLFEEMLVTQLGELKSITNERDLATLHLSNLEIAFTDVHQKYERSKIIIEGYKTNEEKLLCTLQLFKENLNKYDEQLQSITEQISSLNKKSIEAKEDSKMEMNKLLGKIKHLEIKNSCLTDALEQKMKECRELTSLCEEVTGKL